MAGKPLEVAGREIQVSHLDKVLFPDSGITKGQLIDYYVHVAPVALPHYRDRPLTMQRFPDGIAQEGFFQKQAPDYCPDWIERVELEKQDGKVCYLLANDAATLAWLANQACITPHLFLSRRDRPRRPDRLIFDLDPSGDDPTGVKPAAMILKSALDDLEVSSFVQLTGSRGVHVIVPLKPAEEFDTVRDFAHELAALLARRHPDQLTVEHRKARRGKRVFLDYLRNGYAQTAVAPYAVRALPKAPVATPLEWEELAHGELDPRACTLKNLFRRLGQKDDPWREIDRHRCRLDTPRSRLQEWLAQEAR